MPQKNTKRKSTTSTARSKSKVSKSGFGRVIPNKWVAIIFIAIIAALGSYFVFFSQAAPLNCQNDGTVAVCDVDMVSGDTDTILSMGTEAKDLGAKKWGLYFPATFRAPVKSLKGSVPVYRVYNKAATYHDWVVDTEKATKEAKYDIEVQGTPFHVWKTKVEGTVPVYRISRGESHSQSIFSTDKAWVDKMLAAGKDDPKGWKRDIFGKFIAFYAYPPNYKVANQVNPYDCSIAANFTSDRCTTQRENLQEAVQPGSVLQAPAPTSGGSNTSGGGATTQQPEDEGGALPPPVVSKPISKPKPAPKNEYAECPRNIEAYIRGVNKEKKNYHKDCHTWWLTTARNRNELAAFYNAINDCKARGWYYYDFKCNQYSQQAMAWFAGVEAARIACLGRPGVQIWNPTNLSCTDKPAPAPAPSSGSVNVPRGGGPGPAAPQLYTYLCVGKAKWLGTNTWKNSTLRVYAYSDQEANQKCVNWAWDQKRSGLYGNKDGFYLQNVRRV